ncbi:hypothetical protein J4227_06925 [Candidatus Woesearchaeota archaeon]|nr:hypothetical protein [Candidatus Woesearchaeota archaeon]
MVERRIIVDNLKVEYNGLFDATELYKLIDYYFRERAYTKHELRNYEHVYTSGKQVEVHMEPYRKITDYAKYVIKVLITMKHLKEVTVEIDKKKVKLNKGEVEVEFDGYLELDYEHRWEKKPMFYFLRAIFDQYVYKIHTERYEQGLAQEVHDLRSQVRKFLNMQKH